jgi:hypothetical protein
VIGEGVRIQFRLAVVVFCAGKIARGECYSLIFANQRSNVEGFRWSDSLGVE